MSLMDLSNRTLSGCCVSLVMGFSYFLRLKPHEDETRTTARLDAMMNRFEKPNMKKPRRYNSKLDSNVSGVPGPLPHVQERGRRIHSVKYGRPCHHPLYPR